MAKGRRGSRPAAPPRPRSRAVSGARSSTPSPMIGGSASAKEKGRRNDMSSPEACHDRVEARQAARPDRSPRVSATEAEQRLADAADIVEASPRRSCATISATAKRPAEDEDVPRELFGANGGGFQRHQQAGLHLRLGARDLGLASARPRPRRSRRGRPARDRRDPRRRRRPKCRRGRCRQSPIGRRRSNSRGRAFPAPPGKGARTCRRRGDW